MADLQLLPLAAYTAKNLRETVSFAAMVRSEPNYRQCSNGNKDHMLQVFVGDHSTAFDDRLVSFFAPKHADLPQLNQGDIVLFHNFTVQLHSSKVQFCARPPFECFVFDIVNGRWVDRAFGSEPIDAVANALNVVGGHFGKGDLAPTPAAQPLSLFKGAVKSYSAPVPVKTQAPTASRAAAVTAEPAVAPVRGKPAERATPPVEAAVVQEHPRLLRDVSGKASATIIVEVLGVLNADVANRTTSFSVSDFQSEGSYELSLSGEDADLVKRPPGNWMIRVSKVRLAGRTPRGGYMLSCGSTAQGAVVVVAPESVEAQLLSARKQAFKMARDMESKKASDLLDRLARNAAVDYDVSDRPEMAGTSNSVDALASAQGNASSGHGDGGSSSDLEGTMASPHSAHALNGLSGAIYPLSFKSGTEATAEDSDEDLTQQSPIQDDSPCKATTSSTFGQRECTENVLLSHAAKDPAACAGHYGAEHCLSNDTQPTIFSNTSVSLPEGMDTPCGLVTGIGVSSDRQSSRKRANASGSDGERQPVKVSRASEPSKTVILVDAPNMSLSEALSAAPCKFAVTAHVKTLPNFHNEAEIVRHLCKDCNSSSCGADACFECSSSHVSSEFNFHLGLCDNSTQTALDVIVSGPDADYFLGKSALSDMHAAEDSGEYFSKLLRPIVRGSHVFCVESVATGSSTAYYLRDTVIQRI